MQIRLKRDALLVPHTVNRAFLFKTYEDFLGWLARKGFVAPGVGLTRTAPIKTTPEVLDMVYEMTGTMTRETYPNVKSYTYAYKRYSEPRYYDGTEYSVWAIHEDIWEKI